jgi:hypothetical protein
MEGDSARVLASFALFDRPSHIGAEPGNIPEVWTLSDFGFVGPSQEFLL